MSKKTPPSSAPVEVDDIDPADYDIVCAIDGTLPAADKLILDDPDEDVTPLGWIKITVEQRTINPEYVLIMQSKEGMIAGEMQEVAARGVDEAQRPIFEAHIRTRWDALYHAKLKDTPRMLIDTEERYVRLDKKQCRTEWAKIAHALDDIEIGVDEDGAGSAGQGGA